MKTNNITALFITLVGGAILTLNSCSKETQEGRMTVKMTDAPANFLQVNVEVIGMRVHTNTEGWIQIPIQTGVYDLLTLQNDITVVLADSVILPAGMIEQIRLELGPNNSLLTTDGLYPLTVPSGAESGLKINVSQELLPDSAMEIVLDFDAAASIVETGNGGYSLKPVIKIESINR